MEDIQTEGTGCTQEKQLLYEELMKTRDIIFEVQVDVLTSYHEGPSILGNLRNARADFQASLQWIMLTLRGVLFEPVLIPSFYKICVE